MVGSSPRMRGARAGRSRSASPGRIIPADAGSTEDGYAFLSSPQDHPRGCGEHSCGVAVAHAHNGSSPRMRGARCYCRHPMICLRIIPADAGSTESPGLPDCGSQDHPRGCGEHQPCGSGCLQSRGSSPRMRGARASQDPAYQDTRIIPADAGSTLLKLPIKQVF